MSIVTSITAIYSPAMLANVEAHAIACGLALLGTWILIIAAHARKPRPPIVWRY